MIKYKFDSKATRSQKDEIEKYLLDADFMRVLKLTNSYYLQGFYGDYGLIGEHKNGHYYITVTIY